MPAFLTHYACGVESYNHCEEGVVKSCICAHKTVYNTALAGPDLFFYSPWESVRGAAAGIKAKLQGVQVGEKVNMAVTSSPVQGGATGNKANVSAPDEDSIPEVGNENVHKDTGIIHAQTYNSGRLMHKFRTNAFLRNLFEEAMALPARDRAIGIAYFTGFLGHYCLDTSAHPIVYRLTRDTDEAVALGRHFRYEAAMDAFACKYVLHRDIRHAHQLGLLRMSRREIQVVASMITAAFNKTYADTGRKINKTRMQVLLHGYYGLTALLIDPTGFKEWALLQVEKVTKGYPLMSPLFINNNHYGLKQEDWQVFSKRFDRGVKHLTAFIPLVEQAVRSQANAEALFNKIGNRSYHTGREIEWEQKIKA